MSADAPEGTARMNAGQYVPGDPSWLLAVIRSMPEWDTAARANQGYIGRLRRSAWGRPAGERDRLERRSLWNVTERGW